MLSPVSLALDTGRELFLYTNTMDALQLRDNAKNQLLEIKTIESGVEYLNKVKAIEVWAKAEKKDAELQNIIAEQKLRTQRILGNLIREGQQAGELKTPQATLRQNTVVSAGNNGSTLDDIGLTRKQSSTYQAIASIPEEDFEEFIQEKKEAVNNAVAELTTSGAVRLARSLKEKDDALMVNQEVNEEIRVNKEIKELAKEINMKYTKEYRIKLVSLIKI